MARDQDSVQAERAGVSHIAPLALVKLTTYTNRIDKTVDKVFYFSTLACKYDYGNTGTDQMFLPAIIGGSDFFSGMSRPDPNDLTAYSQEFNLQLDNSAPYNGSRMAELLQAHNLEGASIEIAQLFLTHEEMDSYADLKCLDLTGYDGDEHLVLFPGRVNRVAPINSAFLTIQCTTELPSMAGSWLYASDDTKVDPQDLGKRLPRAYGKAKRIPCINWDVGWVTTLSEALDDSETGSGYKVADATGFPAGAFNVRIDGEEMASSDDTDKTFDVDTRGVSGGATAHEPGAVVSELLSTSTYIISDRESDAVNELYVINPLNGELLRLDSGESYWPTIALADTTTISGETITSAKFTATQLKALMEYFKVQAAPVGAVTTQPDFTIDDPQTILLGVLAQEVVETYSQGDPMDTPTGVGTNTRRMDGAGAGTDYYIDGWWPSSSISGSSRVVKRWRLRYEGNGKNTHADPGEDTNVGITSNGMSGSPLNGSGGETAYAVLQESSEVYGLVGVGSWHTPDANTTLADFESNQTILVYTYASNLTDDHNTDEWFEWTFAGLEIELEPSALTRSTDVDSEEGPAVGFGLRFFADVDGIEAPELDVLTWTTKEDFDSGTWEVDGCTVAVDTGEKSEGTGSQKVTVDVDALAGSEVISTDAVTDWTAPNDATVAIDGSEGHRAGSSYAIKGTSTSDSGYARISFEDAATTIDVSDTGSGRGLLVFDFKIKKNGSSGYIKFYFGNDSTDEYSWYVDSDDLDEDTWYTIILDWVEAAGTGVDETDMDYFSVLFNQATQAVGVEVFVDHMKILHAPPSPVIQNNAAGGIDYTGVDVQYRISGYSSGNISPDLTVSLSDDVGSGTTKTASYRDIEFPSSWVADEWAHLKDDSYLDTSAPDVTDVNTVRIEFGDFELATNTAQWAGGGTVGIHLRDPVLEFRVDDLAVPATLGDGYDASAGAALIHPADILRHWIVEVGGEDFDTDAYDALVTSLGAAAEWGFDARSLGFTWKEVLQRMAFEARCNIVPVEKSTGREWKMLAAENDYGFDDADIATITQTHDMTDVGRSVPDLASYLSFRYAFDASLPGGGNEEGFKLALNANPLVSDVPITTALILAAAQRFGAVESGPIAFRCIQDPDTAKDVAGFIVQERMANARRVYELRGVAWYDALPYDVGDIASITAPWSDSATTCRITSMSKAFKSNAWTITAVEVLTDGNGLRTS